MSVESSSAAAHPLVLRLQQNLSSCSKSIGGKDERSSVSELVNFLDSISDAALSEPENQEIQNSALQVLSEIHHFLLSPSLHQEVIDVLSFELPKAVSKYAGLSDRCLEITESIIGSFITMCSPRDMLSVLCEALNSSSRMINAISYVAPLLSGLSKVFLSIQRRHFEQVKVAVPVILNVLKAASLEFGDKDTKYMDLFGRALGIADSIHEVCAKLGDRVTEKLRALLGLYVLQVVALLSLGRECEISSCLFLLSRLSGFFQHCGLSYLGMITGVDVDKMTNTAIGGEKDDYMSCLSYIKHGASLSVIWGHVSDEVAQAAGQNMTAIKDVLQTNQTKRWQAVGMLKHILSSVNLRWELKKHAIDFLLCITNGNITRNGNGECTDCSIYMPSILAALQAITKVIMYAPNAALRKSAFEALKRVLSDTPTSQRFDILQALITKSDSSSMIGILLDLVRGELHMESCQRISIGKDQVLQAENQASSIASLWNAGVFKLIEVVLRPPNGGPPSFPEDGDAVLAALNLYRFILITELAGKNNHTGVLSKNTLQKAYNEWLLPLRTLVTGIMAENKNDYDQFVRDTVCALNPVELVLYRCIELVEENLKHPM